MVQITELGGEEPDATQPQPHELETRPMVKTVKKALDAWGIRYGEVDEQHCQPNTPMITFGMSGESSNYRILLSMDLDDNVFAVYYTSPNKVEERYRSAVAEYFMRINYNVTLGHFDIDLQDGEVRFKVSAVLRGSELSHEMVRQMIGVSMSTMDRFFPGIVALQSGQKTAAEALHDITHSQQEQQQQQQQQQQQEPQPEAS